MQMSEFEDGYRLISGRSQDRNLLPVYFNSAALQKQLVIAKRRQNTVSFTAVAQRLARGAHNSEVTRSKRVAGIYHFASFAEAGRQAGRKREQPLTGMAQGQRAGLITPRSLDRNGLPVSNSFSSFTEATRHYDNQKKPV